MASLTVDVTRNGEEVLALGDGMRGGVERAGFFASFDDNDDVGETGDNAVSEEKRGSFGMKVVIVVVFAGDDATVFDDFLGELGVFAGIDAFDFGAEDGDGFAAAGEGAFCCD